MLSVHYQSWEALKLLQQCLHSHMLHVATERGHRMRAEQRAINQENKAQSWAIRWERLRTRKLCDDHTFVLLLVDVTGLQINVLQLDLISVLHGQTPCDLRRFPTLGPPRFPHWHGPVELSWARGSRWVHYIVVSLTWDGDHFSHRRGGLGWGQWEGGQTVGQWNDQCCGTPLPIWAFPNDQVIVLHSEAARQLEGLRADDSIARPCNNGAI